MATDLSFHHQAFFESAGEHLATMDRLWLELEVENPDPLMLQAILRATHSLKGGAAIVRFDAMAHLAHQVESLLGQICAGSLPLRSEMVDAFLSADDMLKDMLAAHRGGPATDPAAIAAITQRLQELTTAPNSSQADESFGFFAPLPAAEARPAREYKPATASPNCLRPPAPNRSMTMTRKEDHTAGGYAQEFLTFALGPEEYAIDILKVQEIRGYEQPTTLANTPAFIKGVINLRGIIVPIVDMRIKFSVGPADYTQFTVVIILNVGGRVVGIVVDAVSDVTTLRSDQIRPTPEFAATVNTRYINGLGTLNERMLIVVDIEKLMGSNEMALVDTAKAGE